MSAEKLSTFLRCLFFFFFRNENQVTVVQVSGQADSNCGLAKKLKLKVQVGGLSQDVPNMATMPLNGNTEPELD